MVHAAGRVQVVQVPAQPRVGCTQQRLPQGVAINDRRVECACPAEHVKCLSLPPLIQKTLGHFKLVKQPLKSNKHLPYCAVTAMFTASFKQSRSLRKRLKERNILSYRRPVPPAKPSLTYKQPWLLLRSLASFAGTLC